jgi:glycosyltransferase involved in cell wall biosynthesis
MLVTDVGGLREIVPDGRCGYVVSPVAADITTAIIDFYDNAREKSFTEGIIQEKEKFSWTRMTSSILKIFGEIERSF